MYPDNLYDLINVSKTGWILVAFLYAVIDYIFNIAMCWITGGMQKLTLSLQRSNRKSKLQIFLLGGKERLNEFFSDTLSWLWPITVLAFPVAAYGFMRGYFLEVILAFMSININFSDYGIISQSSYIQVALWTLACLSTANGFYRYTYQRKKLTWFSKSITFSVLRSLFFNIPLAYITFNILLLLLSFSISLYGVLLDEAISYNPFHPDQMYGLRTAYEAILSITFVFLIISFLPTIVLLREKKQTYNKMYTILIYSGVMFTFFFMGLLIYQFDQRLELIQYRLLQAKILAPLSSNMGLLTPEVSAALSYYSAITKLPNSFPVPLWLNSLLSIRTVVLGYELLKIFSSNKTSTVKELAQSFISKL